MEIEEIKEWLDWHVENIKDRLAHRQFNGNIQVCYPELSIQLVAGIEIIADVLRLELRKRKQGNYKRLSFMYGEAEVIQLEELERSKDAQQVHM